jgi:restriction endonuclease Mrr
MPWTPRSADRTFSVRWRTAGQPSEPRRLHHIGSLQSGAQTYASNLSTRVVLVDGQRLATLMIRYGVGVQVKQTVQIVEVDEDYFE